MVRKGDDDFGGLLILLSIIGVSLTIYWLIDTWYKNWPVYVGILAVPLLIIGIVILQDYFKTKKLNKEIQTHNLLADKIRKGVLDDYNNILQDQALIKLFDNALIHLPNNIFLIPFELDKFENYILRSIVSTQTFNDLKQKIYNSKYHVQVVSGKMFHIKPMNFSVIPEDFIILSSNKPISSYNSYYSTYEEDFEEFNMFKEIIKTKYSFSSNASLNCCILKLLKERVGKYFSAYWEENYNKVFETSQFVDLKDLVKSYCDILTIRHEDTSTLSIFAYYLLNHGINPTNLKFSDYIVELRSLLNSEFEERKFKRFKKKLTSSSIKTDALTTKHSILDTDFMNGSQFENFVALIFNQFGYKTTVTPASGDQGIDVIAEKNEERIGIQAKCYSNAVTNSAIQEVTAGIAHYKCNNGMVVTNNSFTKSAIKLAESNEIILWDRQKLSNMINEAFS
jgi:HJR/Mrr/RecB family endonuclease